MKTQNRCRIMAAASLLLAVCASQVAALPIAYPFRVTDNAGALVAGATVTVGSTTLTAGSATTVPAAAGEKVLTTNAAPGSTVSMTLLDYGTGDYALMYDPATQGELYIPLTVSKGGSTITGSTALIALVAAADSSTIAAVNTQTAKIGTNAMDSANEVTAQGNTGTILTQTSSAVRQADMTAGLTTQGYTAARAPKLDNADVATSSRMATFTYTAPANPTDYQQRGIAVTLPTTPPTGYGGTGTDTPGTTLLVSRIPGTIQPQSGDAYARLGGPAGASLAADIAAVKADTGGLLTNVAALPAAVWAFTASDGLTHQQSDALRTAVLLRGFAVSYNTSTRTQVTTYYKGDGATALATTTVVYDTTGRPASRTTAFTNLP